LKVALLFNLSVNVTGSESSSESDDSSEDEDHVKDGSVKIKSESPDHDDPDKKHLGMF
jgi:hypothetical protein